MFSPIRSAQSAGHEKIITGFSAAAQYASASFGKPGNADRNDGGTSRAAGLASNNADVKTLRRPAQTAINLFHPFVRCLLGDDERNQGKLGDSGSRGKIAQRTHHCLPTNIERVGLAHKVNALDHAIGFEHEKISAARIFY